jgi:hypothetical protein
LIVYIVNKDIEKTTKYIAEKFEKILKIVYKKIVQTIYAKRADVYSEQF